jgi:DNA polymerase-3 subunit gamma/tau
VLAELAESLAERDPARALVAVAHASEAGRDPQRLAADLAEYLRQGFLVIVAGELVSLSGADRSRVQDTARRMGLPALVRSLEQLGQAQVDMRDIPDQRVHLEVALIKLTHPQADDSTTALLERVERLERALAEGGGGGAGPTTETHPARPFEAPSAPIGRPPPARAGGAARKEQPQPPAQAGSESPGPNASDAPDASGIAESDAPVTQSGPELARRTLGAVRRQSGSGRRSPGADAPARAGTSGAAPPVVPPPATVSPPGPDGAARTAPSPTVSAAGTVATVPSRDELVQVWGDGLLASLPNRARARFRVGRFTDVDGTTAVFALPNETHRSYCDEVRVDVEAALAARFGTAVPIRLVVDDEADDEAGGARSARSPRDPRGNSGGTPSPEAVTVAPDDGAPSDHDGDGSPDLLDPAVLAAETELAGAGLTPEERLKQAFPGAQEV